MEKKKKKKNWLKQRVMPEAELLMGTLLDTPLLLIMGALSLPSTPNFKGI